MSGSFQKYPTVLITGGAGYIGSHAVIAFREAGFPVVVLDNLSTGHKQSVASDAIFYEGNAGDGNLVQSIIADHGISSVVHFAGNIVVPESVENPLKYYDNNTAVSRSLIESCVNAGVQHFIFSSTASVYGEPEIVPFVEDMPLDPINPYGRSKLMTEWMLRDVAAAHDFSYVALRYFNVAGADPKGRTGQSTPGSTHLIKVAVQAALGLREGIEIFGEDYATKDGTCVRDYIHVSDLASAHVHALQYLFSGGDSDVMNCGYGLGYSVHEVLETVQNEAKVKLNIRSAPRRAGDPAVLISDPSRILKQLPWRPQYQDLSFIVKTALEWEARQHVPAQ